MQKKNLKNMKIYYSSTSDTIKVGEIEIKSLEDLQLFRKTIAFNEEIIISKYSSDKDDIFQIEIYDAYRE